MVRCVAVCVVKYNAVCVANCVVCAAVCVAKCIVVFLAVCVSVCMAKCVVDCVAFRVQRVRGVKEGKERNERIIAGIQFDRNA